MLFVQLFGVWVGTRSFDPLPRPRAHDRRMRKPANLILRALFYSEGRSITVSVLHGKKHIESIYVSFSFATQTCFCCICNEVAETIENQCHVISKGVKRAQEIWKNNLRSRAL